MANIVVALLFLLIAYFIFSLVRRHGHGLVPKRVGIESDLGALAATPRVRVRSVTTVGPGRVRVVLAPETVAATDLDLVVSLPDGEFGIGLLQEWQRSETPLAFVVPPGSRLVRLRSVDDLQHLTLRRADGGSETH